MAGYYHPEQTYLQQNRDVTYSNDTPIPINNGFAKHRRGIYFLRRHTRLLNRFKHKVGERVCEEGKRNDNGEEASEKEDKPMLVMAAASREPCEQYRVQESTHLKATPETVVNKPGLSLSSVKA